jgi:uncharacterized membrane-anchored protein
MTLAIAFWVIFLVFVVLGFPGSNFLGPNGPMGTWLVGAILIGLLGWAVFGAMIRG